MNKCLRVILSFKSCDEDVILYFQKAAKKHRIEGTIQQQDKKNIKLVACGKSEDVDAFMDIVYKGDDEKPVSVEVEPFLKDKDYRGVFRVIE